MAEVSFLDEVSLITLAADNKLRNVEFSFSWRALSVPDEGEIA